MIYSAYGLTLSSTFPLAELPDGGEAEPDLHITRSSRSCSERGWTWLQARPKRRKGSWVAVAVRRGEYRLLFDGGVSFLLSPRTRTIAALVRPSHALARVRHRLIDQAVPLLMSHFGRIVLHASAVAMGGNAVVFVGSAGAGKSTLAAAFAKCGHGVLSDDALFLEARGNGWLATPAYPGVRVVQRAQPIKRRLTQADGVPFASRPLPLRRVYVLKEADRRRGAVRISPLPPRDSIMALVEYAFVLDTDDRSRMASHFARVSSAAAALDIREITYPRRMPALALVHDAVISDIEAG